jgi:hypothetical protein
MKIMRVLLIMLVMWWVCVGVGTAVQHGCLWVVHWVQGFPPQVVVRRLIWGCYVTPVIIGVLALVWVGEASRPRH